MSMKNDSEIGSQNFGFDPFPLVLRSRKRPFVHPCPSETRSYLVIVFRIERVHIRVRGRNMHRSPASVVLFSNVLVCRHWYDDRMRVCYAISLAHRFGDICCYERSGFGGAVHAPGVPGVAEIPRSMDGGRKCGTVVQFGRKSRRDTGTGDRGRRRKR